MKARKEMKNKKVFLIILVLLVLGLSGFALREHVLPDKQGGGTVVTVPPAEDQEEQVLPESEQETPPEVPAGDEAEDEVKNTANAGAANTPVKPAEPLAAANGQLSNTKYGWGLVRNSKHLQPEMPAAINNRLSRHGAYWVGDAAEKVVYLTFDNGYENGYTAKIMDALKDNNVPAAFFVTGHYLKDQPELIKRMVREGHIVGNHTDNHPSLPDISDEKIIEELQTVERDFEKITGIKGMKYMRPPQGEYSERTLALTRELGYHNIFWSMAMKDWVPLPGGPQEAYQTVMDNLHNGAVILLHAVSSDNAAVMDRMLKDIKAQGYTFKTLDDLVK